MGSCFSSTEYRTYARGEDPARLTFQYQQTLAAHNSSHSLHSSLNNNNQNSQINAGNVNVGNAQINNHVSFRSKGSKGSRISRVSRMSAVEDPVEELKREVEVLKKRKAFLENIRNALQSLQQEDAESVDSEFENEEFQEKFQQQLAISKKELKKMDNFNMRQFKRRSIQRVKKDLVVKEKEKVPVEQQDLNDWRRVLEGEGTRAWNNFFAARLQVMRKFYDWDEIPLDFFVDKHVQVTSKILSPIRQRLAARLSERRTLNHTKLTLSQKSPQTNNSRSKSPTNNGQTHTPKPPARPKETNNTNNVNNVEDNVNHTRQTRNSRQSRNSRGRRQNVVSKNSRNSRESRMYEIDIELSSVDSSSSDENEEDTPEFKNSDSFAVPI